LFCGERQNVLELCDPTIELKSLFEVTESPSTKPFEANGFELTAKPSTPAGDYKLCMRPVFTHNGLASKDFSKNLLRFTINIEGKATAAARDATTQSTLKWKDTKFADLKDTLTFSIGE
jgi:hypothetical protein